VASGCDDLASIAGSPYFRTYPKERVRLTADQENDSIAIASGCPDRHRSAMSLVFRKPERVAEPRAQSTCW